MTQPAVSHLLPHLYIYLHFIIIIILTFSSSLPFSSQQGSPHHHPRAQRTQTQPCYPSWKYFNSSFVSGFLLLELCSLCGVVFIWLWYISIELMYNNFVIAITFYTPNPFNSGLNSQCNRFRIEGTCTFLYSNKLEEYCPQRISHLLLKYSRLQHYICFRFSSFYQITNYIWIWIHCKKHFPLMTYNKSGQVCPYIMNISLTSSMQRRTSVP